MSSAVASRLREFAPAPQSASRTTGCGPADTRPADKRPADTRPPDTRNVEPEKTIPTRPTIDLEAERRQAREEGRAAAEAEMTARHEKDLAALREEHRAAEAAQAARFEEAFAGRIDQAMATLLAELVATVGDQAASVLAPVVEQSVLATATAEFAEALRQALGEKGARTVRVSGPRSLFERLSSLPALDGCDLHHHETDVFDLAVEIDGTRIATRLAAWRDGRAEAGL